MAGQCQCIYNYVSLSYWLIKIWKIDRNRKWCQQKIVNLINLECIFKGYIRYQKKLNEINTSSPLATESWC